MENFPLPKSIPNVNEQALIASVRELGQVGIKESASRRFEAIQNICNRQNIQQLVHFTNIDNLVNILSIGLVGRDRKSRDLVKFKTNDEFRFDGYPEAICLSISFPNYRMFYIYNQSLQLIGLSFHCDQIYCGNLIVRFAVKMQPQITYEPYQLMYADRKMPLKTFSE